MTNNFNTNYSNTARLGNSTTRSTEWCQQKGRAYTETLGRGANLLGCVGSVGTIVADTFQGIGYFATAIAHGATSEKYNTKMANHLQSFTHILSRPLGYAIKTINPHAKFSSSRSKDGICTHFVKKKLNSALRTCNNSKFWAKRNITSRLVISLRIVASTVARVFDAIIGVGMLLLAVSLFGLSKQANTYATRQLKVTGIVSDLAEGVIQLINPKSNPIPGCFSKEYREIVKIDRSRARY